MNKIKEFFGAVVKVIVGVFSIVALLLWGLFELTKVVGEVAIYLITAVWEKESK